MSTSREELELWFDQGVEQGATHMIVVCDTFSWEDYPVYVRPGEDAHERADTEGAKSMQKLMEVYNLAQGKDEQLGLNRCWKW